MKANEHDIFCAALAARIGLPTDVDLLVRGLAGLTCRAGVTVGQVADRIIADYGSGELAQRISEGAKARSGAVNMEGRNA